MKGDLQSLTKVITKKPQRYTPGSEGKVGGETEEWMRYRYFMHYVEGSLIAMRACTVFTL
jgi:glutathione S-transferase